MKREEFLLCSANNNYRREIKALGYRVSLPEFEPYEFIVHRPLRHDKGQQTRGWMVSELSTGAAVYSWPDRTRNEAIQHAVQRIGSAGGISAFEAAVNRIKARQYTGLFGEPLPDNL